MIKLLLITRIKTIINFFRHSGGMRMMTIIILGLILFGFFLFGFLGKVLKMAVANPDIGNRLVDSLAAISVHGMFILMCFYGLSYAVYSVYFGKDLELLLFLPIKKRDIFLFKVTEAAIFNCRISMVLALPALIIAGIYYGAGVPYYVLVPIIILILTAIPGSLGIMAASLIAKRVSRTKIRNTLAVSGAIIGLLVWGGFNLLSKSLNTSFASVGGDEAFLNISSSPAWNYFPSGWASLAALDAARGSWLGAAFNIALLLAAAAILTFLAYRSISWYFAGGVAEEFSGPAGMRMLSIRGGSSPLWAHLRRDFMVIFREINALTQSIILLIFLIIFPFITGAPKGGEPFPLAIPPTGLIFANMLGCHLGSRLIPLERRGFWLNLVTPAGNRLAILSKSIIGLILCWITALIAGLIHIAGGITAETNYILYLGSFSWAGFGLGMTFSAFFSNFGWENPNRMLRMAGLVMYLLSMIGIVAPLGMAAILAGEVFPGIINPGFLVILLSWGVVLILYLISSRKISNLEWGAEV